MAIFPADLALLEGSNHRSQVYLNFWPLTSVATATVDQVSFVYPIAELTVTGASAGWLTDVKAGMMVRITSSGDHVTTAVVRRDPTLSTSLLIDAKHRGDPGRTQDIQVALANAQSITIYNYYPLWTIFSVIRDGVFYKEWDLAYTNEGDYPAPVCNMGAWRQAFVDSGGTAELTFDASGSYDWKAAGLTYLWELPASGATLTSGTLTDASIDVEFDPGFYLMACTVSNGTSSQRGVRPVWINETSGSDAPFSVGTAIEIAGDNQDLQGREVSYQVWVDAINSALSEANFPDGGAVIMSEYAEFDGSALSDAALFVDTYVGFLNEIIREVQHGITSLSFDTKSPIKYIEDFPCPPQALSEVASPSDWNEVAQNLATPSFVAWYIMQYQCPSLLRLFDYHKLTDTQRKSEWAVGGDRLGDKLKEVASIVAGEIGSSSNGSIYFWRNPNVEALSYRSPMENRMEITDQHLVGQVRIPYAYRPAVGELRAYGWYMDGNDITALESLVGDGAQGQGTTKTQSAALVVDSQATLNIMAGNLMAIENRPIRELRFRMHRNIDVADPARDLIKWWDYDIPAEYDPRGEGIIGSGIIVAVSRSWNRIKSGYSKSIEWTIQPESRGQNGVTVTKAVFPGSIGQGTVWGYDDVGTDLGLSFYIDENGDLNWRRSAGQAYENLGEVTQTLPDENRGEPVSPDPVPVIDRPSGQSWPCVSAANIVEYVDQYQLALVDAIDNATSPFDFRQRMGVMLNVVMAPSLEFNDLLTKLYNEWYGGTSATITAAFSASFMEDLLYVIYCNLNSDGQLDNSSFGDMILEFESGTAWDITRDLFEVLQPGGINSAAQMMGIASEDCSGASCTNCGDWLENTDFTLTDGGYATYPAIFGESIGQYVSTEGWRETDTGLALTDGFQGVVIRYTITPTVITRVGCTYDAIKGFQDKGITYGARFILQLSGGVVYDSGTTAGFGYGKRISYSTGGISADSVEIWSIVSIANNPVNVGGGYTRIYQADVCGNGSNPF
jgi:hypothetical protein